VWSESSPSGEFLLRGTVSCSRRRTRLRVNADMIGRWAYHCHLLYHMEAGMFREVVVA
jgi:FtsP/CotA-like multicopper oxidase with cupredoxin domain